MDTEESGHAGKWTRRKVDTEESGHGGNQTRRRLNTKEESRLEGRLKQSMRQPSPVKFDSLFLSSKLPTNLSMSAGRKRKRPAVVSFNETQHNSSVPASALLVTPTAFGTTLKSRRITTSAFRDPNRTYATPNITPLETLLENLEIDPVEKAEQDAGISIQIKCKRYQNSVNYCINRECKYCTNKCVR